MLLDIAVNLAQQTPVSHAVGKIAIGDGALGIHLGEKIVATDLGASTKESVRASSQVKRSQKHMLD